METAKEHHDGPDICEGSLDDFLPPVASFRSLAEYKRFKSEDKRINDALRSPAVSGRKKCAKVFPQS